MSDKKAAIRRVLRAQRARLSEDQIGGAALAVASRVLAFGAYREARAVAAYVATDGEIPVDRVVADVAASGRMILLPHQGCSGFVRWEQGEPLFAGHGGILEPSASRATVPSPPAIVLVPLVAWDSTGCRLGRGGGFYDRVLAGLHQDVAVVGIGYEFQEYRRIPCDPWDVPVHYVITERRVVTCATTRVTRSTGRIQKGGLSRHG